MRQAPLDLLQKIKARRISLDRDFIRAALRYRSEIQLLGRRGAVLNSPEQLEDEKLDEIGVRLTRRATRRLENADNNRKRSLA